MTPDSKTVISVLDDDSILSSKNKTNNVNNPELTKRGLILLGTFGGLFAGIYAVATPFVSPALRRICLPFVPATPLQIQNVFTALTKQTGSLIDIGSGDGRIVLDAARRGFKSSGVELNYWLVLYSRYTAWKNGLSSQVSFFRKDLWKTSLSQYDNVIIFGVEQMMPKLEEKLDKELVDGRHVVACRFPFPTWQPEKTIGTGVDTVWLYIKGREKLDKDNHNNPV
ncbi:hypothetical protein SNE40_009871 [Patella caerulea]|uniref:ATP synthase subunit C lysine N-methyltransferase n=1 Tax=Patella caerulea TaxID=87958 RepID=A0AAN8PS97_PATCE